MNTNSLRAVAAAIAILTSAVACTHSRSPVAPTNIPNAGRDNAPGRPTNGAPTVRFLLVNDVYTADTLRDGTGGLARVAFIRDSIERATGSRVLYVLAGDVWSPSLLGKWYGGAQMNAAFNASRLDFAAFGNHEFDGSRANVVARVAESKFRWLSGNCTEKGGVKFPGVRGWDTVTVNGIRVGIFGTVIVREYPSYVQCADADSVTHALVDTLSRVAQLIVGITHRNMSEDMRTLSTEPKVQAILGGHEHIGRRAEVDGRLVIKALSNARSTALVTFTLRNGKWVRTDTVFNIGRGNRSDTKTETVVAAWRDSLAKHIGRDRVLATTNVAIDATDSTQHKGESAFGDLITDAMRVGTKADVAIINSGALRFDDYMGPGAITSHMLESVFLFADETRAVTFTLTGKRLREVLEHGVVKNSLGQGAFPQLSGVKFTYDTGRPDGARIVGPIARENGVAYGDADVVRVSLVTYPACRGGDGYKVPEAAEACKAAESAPRTAQLLIDYVGGMGGRVQMPEVGRVLRVSR